LISVGYAVQNIELSVLTHCWKNFSLS